MASKLHDPARLTIYADNSTLCDAFRAHRAHASEHERVYAPLFGWFERVAHEANLCLSPTAHLGDLGQWDDQATSDAMCSWYASLPIVWVRSIDRAQQLEDEHWVKVAAHVPDEWVGPFAPALLGAFGNIDQDAAAALLAAPEPERALVRVMRTPRWRELWQNRYVTPFIDHLIMIAANHDAHRARPGWNEQMGRDDVAFNLRVDIRRRALEADTRLTRTSDPAYARRNISNNVQDLLVHQYQQSARALPILRVTQRFNEGAIARVERGQVTYGQPSNKLRRALSSSVCDYMHLVGAAYCDVFTRDGDVARWLGGIRAELGLRPQLTTRGYLGGPSAFVRDLMATWP